MNIQIQNLKIDFPDSWTDISNENPGGPSTFIKAGLDEPGVLQISKAEYVSGKLPDPGYNDLVFLSENIGLKNSFGEIIKKESGDCSYGKYGLAQFSRTDFPHISVWHLSNGKDFVFSTFICSKYPDISELDDVKKILMTLSE